MAAGPHPSPRLHFGPFAYDIASGQLTKFGTLVRLQGQPQQILTLLTQRPGELVTREELQQRLWQGQPFGDFDRGLNTAVNRLRQTLGDSADQPRYIETVPGQGYRFVAPTHLTPPRPVIEIPRQSPPVEKRLSGRLPALAAAIACLGVLGYSVLRKAPVVDLPQVTFAVTPPAGFELEGASSRQSFALSPDGARLAFTAMDASGAYHVFVRDLKSIEARQLPKSEGAHTVFWAPDSQNLYYTAKGRLYRSLPQGEVRQALASTPAFLFMGTEFGPSSILLSSKRETFELSVHGGEPKAIEANFSWPQTLPGREVLFVEDDRKPGSYGVRVANPDAPGTGKTVAESHSRALYTESVLRPGTGYLLYLRQGTLLAHPFDASAVEVTGEPIPIASDVYSFTATGAADISAAARGILAYQPVVARSRLVWVDRRGHLLSAASPENLSVKSGALSPDGKSIAAALYNPEKGAQNLWILDTITGAKRVLVDDGLMRDAPVWSPDSRRIAYFQNGSGWPGVAIRGLGVDDPENLPVLRESFQVPASWSPDGRFLAYTTTGFVRFANEQQSDLFVIDLESPKRPSNPLAQSPFNESAGAFSPDGLWMAFTSNESGQEEIYLQRFTGGDRPRLDGQRFAVTRGGAQALKWRGDGRELFYLGFDGRVNAVPVKLGPRPSFGAPEPLFEISTEARAAVHSIMRFDASPDGQRFLVPKVTGGERPAIIVVQNWEASLKR
jgi:Tol biopolymer transport system component/DNA-binding winged helix-turn-helix (wHTH) protein